MHKFNPKKLEACFELLGLDFMIDQQGKLWLIEINTNPCFAITSPVTGKIIPDLIDNVCRLVLDPLMSNHHSFGTRTTADIERAHHNKFECICSYV